ncbi:MAG: amidoligase family protein [Myxococcota bacterium]
MSHVEWSPPLPPRTRTAEGEERHVGVEMEFIGLDVAEVSRLVAEHLGGRVEARTRYEHVVVGDEAGEWGVELDYEYLKKKGREPPDEDEFLALLDEAAESVVRAGAEIIVPVEIVSPPLPMPRLADVHTMVRRLREAGARGTGAGVAYAFGMQLNPEMPALDAGTIARYLKAFLCLNDWLVERTQVDFTRKLTRFVAPFPHAYVRKVVDPAYWPDLGPLIDDYLVDNPTRNRPLDFLPLFLHVDPERVRRVVHDPRVKSRPAMHYRLPDCDIDRPEWGIHVVWADWLQVEHLASEPERLEAVCERYSALLDHALGRLFEDWAEEVRAWLRPPEDL